MKHGIHPGTLYQQPEFSISIEQDGKWTITQVYMCVADSAVALMPRPGSEHPKVSFCTLSKVEAKVSEGDLAEITATYAGVQPNPDKSPKSNATYSLSLALSEEPLLSHKAFEALEKNEIAALQKIIAGKDKDETGIDQRSLVVSEKGILALAKIDRGETHYYSPKVTWKASWTGDQPAVGTDLAGIGCIDATPLGPYPNLPDGRNWLFNGMTQTQEGKAYKLEAEWISSDSGGWDTDLYHNG